MSAAKTSLAIKDGLGTPRSVGALDESGVGTGPFDPTHAAVNTAGALINPATDDTLAAMATALEAGLGTDGTVPPSLPGGATGVRGWLRYIGSLLAGTLTVTPTLGGAAVSAANPLPTTLVGDSVTLSLPAGLAQDASVTAVTSAVAGGLGTDGTGAIALPGGATGVRGWLRYLGSLLAGTLTVTPTLGGAAVSAANPLPTTLVGDSVTLSLPAGLAQDASVTAVTSAVAAGLGTDGTSAPGLPGGATGVRGWLRYIGSLLAGTLTVSVADGSSVTLGAKADAAATSASSGGSLIAWTRGVFGNTNIPVSPRTYTDKSGTTSGTANTFMTAIAANTARQLWRITHTNTAGGTLYVYDKASGTPTPANSIPIQPNGYALFDSRVSGAAIQIAGSLATMSYEAAEGV